MSDPNRTQMGSVVAADPNRTILGDGPSLNTTITIKPVQCPVCKTFNPPGLMYCSECGLIFELALDGDAFGAPSVQLPVLVDGSGREHQLRPGSNVLGRQGDLMFEDTRVSRRHAEVTVSQAGLSLKDLGSTNGTSLNGEKLSSSDVRPLANADVLSLGGFTLTLSLPGETNKTLAAMSGKTSAMAAPPTLGEIKGWLAWDGQEVPLRLGTHQFGRRSDNDIVISDPFVSGRHGEFEVTEDGVFLTDTGSSNGTLLNEAKLAAGHRTQLRVGDVIKLGNIEATVRFPE